MYRFYLSWQWLILLPEKYSNIDIYQQAKQHGLGIRALSTHYLSKGGNGLIIGFAGFNQREINQGVAF